MLRAIIIYELGNGKLIKDIQRRWNITGLERVQERWRDHLLRQLSGLRELFEIRNFYYFLREEYQARDEQKRSKTV